MRTSISDTLAITVHEINDAPVMSAIPNVSTNEDQLLVLTLIGSDADNDSTYYSVVSSNEVMSEITNEGMG